MVLNTNFLNEDKVDKVDFINFSMMVLGHLTDIQHANLKEKWESQGGFEACPWWEFILKNVELTIE